MAADMKHRTAFALTALAGAALDLLSKWIVFSRLGPYDPDVVVISGLFNIGRTTNKGIVFGLFQGAGGFFLVISLLAVPAILAIYLSIRKPRWILTAALALILGGTLGNLYDRVAFGEVRDFIKFHWHGRIWPLFNLADSYICVGVALLSVEMLFFDDKKRKAEDPGMSTAKIAAGPTEPMPRADVPEISHEPPKDAPPPASPA